MRRVNGGGSELRSEWKIMCGTNEKKLLFARLFLRVWFNLIFAIFLSSTCVRLSIRIDHDCSVFCHSFAARVLRLLRVLIKLLTFFYLSIALTENACEHTPTKHVPTPADVHRVCYVCAPPGVSIIQERCKIKCWNVLI